MSFQFERAQHVDNKMNDTKHVGIPRNIIKVHNSRSKTIVKASRDQRVGGGGRGREVITKDWESEWCWTQQQP